MMDNNSFKLKKEYRSEFLRHFAESATVFEIAVECTHEPDGMDKVTLHYDSQKVDGFTVGFMAGQISMEVVTRLKFDIGVNRWKEGS